MAIYQQLPRVYRIGTNLSFVNERNQEVEGVIHELEIRINEHQEAIIYTVMYNNRELLIDGETFRIIKTQL